MNRKRLIFGVVAFACLLGLGLGLYFGIKGYRDYQQTVLNPQVPDISVQLSTLSGNSEGTVGSPILLVAQAFGDVPLERFIFWINDIPVKLVGVENEGAKIAEAFFSWVPTMEGDFVLFTRVEGENSISADSEPLIIQVLPGLKPVSPEPVLPDPTFNRALPGAVGETGDGQIWRGSLGGWVSQSSEDSPPSPPGLTVEVNGCDVVLTIHDNSDNETGFRVYRHLPNIPGWKMAAVLQANNTFDTLNFSDSGYHGLLSYKVAVFNDQGEAVSNPVSVEVNSNDCPTADLPIMKLKVVELLPKVPVDQTYCYFSIGGAQWLRWPKEGYLSVNEDGFIIPQESILSILQESPELDGSFSELLLMDCWGWDGGELVDLGKFEVGGIGPAAPEPFIFSNDFLEGVLEFGNTSTMEGEIEGFPYAAFLPVPVLSHSDSVYDCLDKKDDQANIPYDYCLEADGETDWPFKPSYITWELANNCQLSPMCLGLMDLEEMAEPELSNAEIGYRVYSHFPNKMVRSFNSPSQMVYMVPGALGPYQCRPPLNLQFRVSTYLIPDGSQEMYESGSYWFSVPEPCPAVNGGIIKVVPEMLFVGNPEEEPDEGQMLDLYGAVIIYTGNMNELRVLQFGEGGDQIAAGCPAPDSTDEAGGANYGGECPISNGWGVDLAQAYICPDAGFNGCFSNFAPFNNQAELTILEGESLHVWITVMDHDINSADDEVCSGETILPAWVVDDWTNSIVSEDLIVSAFGNYGSCLLNFSVQELLQFTN